MTRIFPLIFKLLIRAAEIINCCINLTICDYGKRHKKAEYIFLKFFKMINDQNDRFRIYNNILFNIS